MSILSEAQQEQFRTDGFCVLDDVVPAGMLRLLRDECATFIRLKDEEMDRAGTDTLGISHRGSRYFVSNCHLVRPQINGFLHSDLMTGICRDTLGPDAYMFYNQYVVKGAEAGMKFSWHQDSGYVNANGGDIGTPALSHHLDTARRRHRGERHHLCAAAERTRHPHLGGPREGSRDQ